MSSQTIIPDVEEITLREINKKIDEKKEGLTRLLNMFDTGKCQNSKNNELLNLIWLEGALKSIIQLNRKDQGIGEITLRRYKKSTIHGLQEHVISKIKYVINQKDEESKLISKTSYTQEIAHAYQPAVNWEEMDGGNIDS